MHVVVNVVMLHGMACSRFCDVEVDYKEKCTANNHIKSRRHQNNTLKKPTLVTTPGMSNHVISFISLL